MIAGQIAGHARVVCDKAVRKVSGFPRREEPKEKKRATATKPRPTFLALSQFLLQKTFVPTCYTYGRRKSNAYHDKRIVVNLIVI